MNRKIRFLMLFVFAISSIFGVYLISGCGDDTVVEAPIPEVRDTLTVVGSIQGVVKGAYDNQPINGATVQYIKDTTTQTVTTDAAGKYVINDSLSSGGYVLTFSFGGHASMRGNAYIPTLEELKGDQDNQQSGLIKFVDTLDMVMFETNSSVSGRIWAAPPLAQKNGNLDPFAADTNASLQSGVSVTLDWGTLFKDMGGDTVAGSYDIVPSAASTTTDDSGWYFFTNVPAVTSGYVKLMTGPFSRADSLFGDSTMFIKLLRGQNRSVPDLFVPVLCTSAPGLVRKNFDNVSRFNYFDSLVIVFSQPIDTTGSRFMATLVGQNSGAATF
ncbi:MAG: carboxypeptidase regulatory-like domain-containing protein, partial [Candidatus Zixiibacteriota bacterium]